jgi:hypothetical protein
VRERGAAEASPVPGAGICATGDAGRTGDAVVGPSGGVVREPRRHELRAAAVDRTPSGFPVRRRDGLEDPALRALLDVDPVLPGVRPMTADVDARVAIASRRARLD